MDEAGGTIEISQEVVVNSDAQLKHINAALLKELPDTTNREAYILGFNAAIRHLEEFTTFGDVELCRKIMDFFSLTNSQHEPTLETGLSALSYHTAQFLMRDQFAAFLDNTHNMYQSEKYRSTLRQMDYFKGFISAVFAMRKPHLAFLLIHSIPRLITTLHPIVFQEQRIPPNQKDRPQTILSKIEVCRIALRNSLGINPLPADKATPTSQFDTSGQAAKIQEMYTHKDPTAQSEFSSELCSISWNEYRRRMQAELNAFSTDHRDLYYAFAEAAKDIGKFPTVAENFGIKSTEFSTLKELLIKLQSHYQDNLVKLQKTESKEDTERLKAECINIQVFILHLSLQELQKQEKGTLDFAPVFAIQDYATNQMGQVEPVPLFYIKEIVASIRRYFKPVTLLRDDPQPYSDQDRALIERLAQHIHNLSIDRLMDDRGYNTLAQDMKGMRLEYPDPSTDPAEYALFLRRIEERAREVKEIAEKQSSTSISSLIKKFFSTLFPRSSPIAV